VRAEVADAVAEFGEEGFQLLLQGVAPVVGPDGDDLLGARAAPRHAPDEFDATLAHEVGGQGRQARALGDAQPRAFGEVAHVRLGDDRLRGLVARVLLDNLGRGRRHVHDARPRRLARARARGGRAARAGAPGRARACHFRSRLLRRPGFLQNLAHQRADAVACLTVSHKIRGRRTGVGGRRRQFLPAPAPRPLTPVFFKVDLA
jgi:hypothetical protein